MRTSFLWSGSLLAWLASWVPVAPPPPRSAFRCSPVLGELATRRRLPALPARAHGADNLLCRMYQGAATRVAGAFCRSG